MPLPEGRIFRMESPDEVRNDFLETFEFDSPDQLIETISKEFSAVCPFSGLPDVATLIIKYHPRGGKCIELKSLKYYLTSFRNVGLYQEGCTKRIYDDLVSVLETTSITVETLYNTRGGFDTRCKEGELLE